MGSVHSSFLNKSSLRHKTWPSKKGATTSNGNDSNCHDPLVPSPPLVYTDKGPVLGKRHRLKEDGRFVNVFLGIPFAKPPLGLLRFKKPESPDPWGPVALCAQSYRPRAIQRDFFWDTLELGGVPKSEDCLYLNVIAPAWKNDDGDEHGGWPVMVYIHGGGYIMDSAVKYHYAKVAQNLVRHGVIVVTIQYRLGLLGFLCTGDDECAGNFGLWDQLFALRWVHRNIAAFGGNPARITLFGHSAGAASADLLSLSPLSRDLFSQMILMGGSAETKWAVSEREVLAEYCRKKAKQFGFRPTNRPQWDRVESERMVDFLRILPPEKFEHTMLGDRSIIDEMRLVVSPVIDGELFPKSLAELRAESPAKRVLCGQCRYEGLLFLALGMRRANTKLLTYCEQRIMELLVEAQKRFPLDETKLLAADNGQQRHQMVVVPKVEEVRQLYGIDDVTALVGNKAELQRTCVTIMSDLVNNLAMHNFCQANVQKSGAKVWRYIFDHYNPDSSWGLNPLLPFKASTHGNELHYVFDINFFVIPWRRTATDRAVLERTTKWWTNFAKWGDPNGASTKRAANVDGNENGKTQAFATTIHWETLNAENIERHMHIGSEPRMKETSADNKRIEQLALIYRALVHSSG